MARLRSTTTCILACSAFLLLGACNGDEGSPAAKGGDAGSAGAPGDDQAGSGESGGTSGLDAGTGGSGNADNGGETPEFVTEATCEELPAVFDGSLEGEDRGAVCVTIDWMEENNSCVVQQVACENQEIVFEWEHGTYFNVKFYDDDEVLDIVGGGTIFEKPPNSSEANAALGMPEGESVLVRLRDAATLMRYDMSIRLDGDALTIEYLITLFG